jgi:hypothetical protein
LSDDLYHVSEWLPIIKWLHLLEHHAAKQIAVAVAHVNVALDTFFGFSDRLWARLHPGLQTLPVAHSFIRARASMDGKRPEVGQDFPFAQAVVLVELEQFLRGRPSHSHRLDLGAREMKVVAPSVRAWMEQAGELWRLADQTPEVAALGRVAARARPSEVAGSGGSAMLAADDVVCLTASIGVLFQAISSCSSAASQSRIRGVDLPQATVLGLTKSFGFGDRLGLATPGHLAAVRKTDFAPIFAQQSVREMTRTQRTPEEVMRAAQTALAQKGYQGVWGADADHLKTPQDVRRTAAAGFCFFTIDPSEFVSNQADALSTADLNAAVAKLDQDQVFPDVDWREFYLNQRFDLGAGFGLQFTNEGLQRAAVKYARAIAQAATMGRHIAQVSAGRAFEIEISVDETDSPTSPLEHLFFGLELKRRRVPNVVSLAPRFVGEFQKGIDYRGDLKRFEAALREHVAIAKFCGPYKLSVHSGSDKFAVYPILGRVCGDLLHVKTAGTSYLEALRVVARTEPRLFAEIATYCRGQFEADRASYHISTTSGEVAALPVFTGPRAERVYLDERVGRQLLHVTFGSVLTTGKDALRRPFRASILNVLNRHEGLHREFLEQHLGKHLALLNQG